MIRYVNTSGNIQEEKYNNHIKYINLSHRDIIQILKIEGFSNLQTLRLQFNKIEEISGLDGLTSLRKLTLCYNQIKEINGLDGLTSLQELVLDNNRIKGIKGIGKLTNLKILWLHNNQIKEIEGLEKLNNLKILLLCNNQIKEIKGLEKLTNLQRLLLNNNHINEIKGLDELNNLQELMLFHNQINEIKGLDELTSLRELSLINNQIKEIKGLDRLTSLQKLTLSYNQIKEITKLDRLTSLKVLWLDNNQIKEIKGLDRLINLQQLNLNNNQIKEIPFTIMNLRNLNTLYMNYNIPLIIQRFLDTNRIKSDKTIYNDSQNVHDSDIVKSVKNSIYNIISESKNITIDSVLKEIVDDKVLEKRTKSQLVEYCQDKTVHSLLNLTFEEVLCSVWNIIIEHKESNEIKKVLNEEMKDSMCKCFTGRLSRLVNCLNGFDSRVSIQINDKEQILNVIIKIRNKYFDDIEKQKEEVIKQLTERGFDQGTISEYIVYLE